MVHDPSDPFIDEYAFELKDWTSSEYRHLQGKEELPQNMLKPRRHIYKRDYVSVTLLCHIYDLAMRKI
jgi:pyruvate-formate lyase-activating enzyme